MARALIRASYHACTSLIKLLARPCAAAETVESAAAGASLSLEPVPERLPEEEASSGSMVREGEEHGSEEVVQGDIEVGVNLSMEEGELDVVEGVMAGVDGPEVQGVTDVGHDSRLECWEWPHDWEDLDWDEEMWLEDERSSADINEAVLPDELWD